MILVTGFGPFRNVDANPSGRVALAVHGRIAGAHEVAGMVLPVRWRVGPELAIAAARELQAEWVIGLGVATARTTVDVEAVAQRVCDPTADAAGDLAEEAAGPERVAATVDVPLLARALGARISLDAGRYVCNAWLYQVARALPEAKVGFVHMSPAGLDPELLLAALDVLVASPVR